MKIFEFSTNVVDNVIKELNKAKEYINIAVFQIHKKELFDLLEKKLESGVKVQILTLPFDSINENVRKKVVGRYLKVEKKGAKLFFCKWNVGDPERTTTAIGHWYSYHGKFIVSENAAIALSANFLQEPELDACLIFRNDKEKISQFEAKFQRLVDLFINEGKASNNIKSLIMKSAISGAKDVFLLPRVIETSTHKDNWIRHYPEDTLRSDVTIKDKLYISPIDIKARELYMKIIERAKKYVYIATESFTDVDFAEFLEKIKVTKEITIRILTGGATAMDYSDRVKNMTRKLLACGIKIKRAGEDLHSKLLITDNSLVVSSVNLNKINLGFKVNKQFWRGNTETLTINSDPEIIKTAKESYKKTFQNSAEITEDLEKTLRKEISQIFNKTFEVTTRKEAKDLLTKYILKEELELKTKLIKICKFSVKLMKKFKKKTIDTEVLLLGLIVFWLSDQKQTKDAIQEKTKMLSVDVQLGNLLKMLLDKKIIEKENDFYKLDINSLI
jgi:phosphatidylserine/phosphatidylglycerophosphate/cardiolipin synthase-like enzyme